MTSVWFLVVFGVLNSPTGPHYANDAAQFASKEECYKARADTIKRIDGMTNNLGYRIECLEAKVKQVPKS